MGNRYLMQMPVVAPVGPVADQMYVQHVNVPYLQDLVLLTAPSGPLNSLKNSINHSADILRNGGSHQHLQELVQFQRPSGLFGALKDHLNHSADIFRTKLFHKNQLQDLAALPYNPSRD